MSPTGTIVAAFRGTLGAFALDARFTVPAQGVSALFGPSGCGKTSVLRCIAGLHRVADGLCRVDGEAWQDRSIFVPPHRRDIGYVFQEASLFPHLSVERNLLYGAGGRRPPEGPGQVGWSPVVELLGLSRLLGRAPGHLSGGERQRVAIGRALLSQPRLLLMDEPLSALDRASRDEILPFLQMLPGAVQVPILYVSHDMREVEQLADRLILMAAGRVQSVGSLQTLQSDPALPLAAGRDAAVTLDAVVGGYDATYGLLDLVVGPARFLVPGAARSVGERLRLRVAAGDVSLTLEPPHPSTILNVVPVHLRSATPLGPHEMMVFLDLGTGDRPLLARITRRSWDGLGLAGHARAFAQIKSVALTATRR